MRIEVLVGSEEPKVYNLQKPTVSLGSSPTNDIVIHSPQVSRKHLLFLVEGEDVFVTDQGSTNGTFMNEERLVPGRRTLFKSFFPLRLGTEILITLVNEDEIYFEEVMTPPKVEESASESKTEVVSLGELQSIRTEKLIQRRQKAVKKSQKKQTPKKDNGNPLMTILALLILGGSLYYHFTTQEQSIPAPPLEEVGKIIEVPQELPAVTPQLIPENELTAKERLLVLLGDFKCLTDFEKMLCESVQGLTKPWGVSQTGSMLHIMADGTPFLKEARQLETGLDEIQVKEMAGLLFLTKAFPRTLDLELLKEMKITVALFISNGEEQELLTTFAAYPESLQKLKDSLKPESVFDVNLLNYAKTFYRSY